MDVKLFIQELRSDVRSMMLTYRIRHTVKGKIVPVLCCCRLSGMLLAEHAFPGQPRLEDSLLLAAKPQ